MAQLSGGGRWEQQGGQLGHARVLFGRLARKPEQQIPVRPDSQLFAPFHELDVLESGDALPHQRQHGVAQALDPRLNRPDSRLAEQANLILLEARLRLVEQIELRLARGEFREDRLEVLQIQDIVDDGDVASGVALSERHQLVDGASRRFAAVAHRGAVQAAERAVHPLAPPASARRFEKQRRLPRPSVLARFELREIIAEIRDGQVVHVLHGRRRGEYASIEFDGNGLARPDPLESAAGGAGEHALDELWKDAFRLARHDSIDKWELADRLRAHDAFAIRSAERDEDIGTGDLDPAGEGERRDVLLEDTGEPDDPRLVAQHLFEAPLQKRVDLAACGENAFDQRWRDGRDEGLHRPRPATQQDIFDVSLLVFRGRTEERVGKNPLASELACAGLTVLGDALIEGLSHPLGKWDREIPRVRRDAATSQARLEQAQADRRGEYRSERHRHQQDVHSALLRQAGDVNTHR